MYLKTGYDPIMRGRLTQMWYRSSFITHFSCAATELTFPCSFQGPGNIEKLLLRKCRISEHRKTTHQPHERRGRCFSHTQRTCILYFCWYPNLSITMNGSPERKNTLSWMTKLPMDASWKSVKLVIRYCVNQQRTTLVWMYTRNIKIENF